MPHQYYKILSVHGKKDIVKISGNSAVLKENVYKSKDGKVDYSKFTHILQRCLDTDYLMSVCKKNKENFGSVHPTKFSKDLFLGYSEAFISVKITKDVRDLLYLNGFEYNNKHYVRYKRSASSAKNGNCLFILSEFKEIMDTWSNCGLDSSRVTASSLTSCEAYSALTLSGIQDTFSLPHKSILIIKDLQSDFKTSGIGVYLDEDNHLTSTHNSELVICNKIWDGECLIDESVFEQLSPEFSDKHMLLLRNRFFKSCGFKTKLQKWFKDNKITNPKSLNGYTTAQKIEDIKIVITESSLKYLKFYQGDKKSKEYLKEALQDWFKGLGRSNSVTFGIVKSDVPSRYSGGKMVQTNYQLLNTLGLNEKEAHELIMPIINYIEKAKTNPHYFINLLKNHKTISIDDVEINEYDSGDEATYFFDYSDTKLYNYKENTAKELLSLTDASFHTQICKTVRNRCMDEVKQTVACGRFLVPGTYATLFGNPIEFLVSIIQKDYRLPERPEPICMNICGKETKYPTLVDNEIYTTMFDDGVTLCGARSPHITMGNLFLGKNTYLTNEAGNSFIRDYFDLSPQIVCVNSINHNLLQRLNGADFDSDTILLTNHPTIVEATRRQRDFFPVPVNCLNENPTANINSATVFNNVNDRTRMLIEIDNKIADNIIGQIVNTSQLLNSILWTRFPTLCAVNNQSNPSAKEDLLSFSYDYIYGLICELEVLSNIEIDKAKRTYLDNPTAEYRRLLDYVKTYQLEHVSGEYVMGNIPDYLIAIRNSKWAQKALEEDTTPTTKWAGMILRKTDNIVHHSTMKYIYSFTMENIKDAPKVNVVPLSKLVSEVYGIRENADPFHRIKIICAYYYLLIRTCYFITSNGSRNPDYGNCSKYVASCYHAVEKIINDYEEIKEFIIYSIIKELDEASTSNNAFIVRNLASTIDSWSNKKRYAKSDDLVKLVNKIVEDNKKRSNPKSKLPIDENYGDLLLSALLNAKDNNGTSILKEMILKKC